MFSSIRLWPAAALCTLLVAASGARSEDWPCFRGPRIDGTSTETKFPLKWSAKENVVWKVKLPGPGASSPIVFGERVFVTCFTGKKAKELERHLFCFDRTKGDLLWKKDYPAPQPENDYESYLLQHGFASSTPATDGERLYVYFGRDGVRAFDLDGKELWHEMVGKAINGFGSGSSPLIYGEKLIINSTVELGSMVALDRKTGKRLWKAPINGDCWATPIVITLEGGKKELLVNGAGAIYGFDPETGKELWYVETVGGHISSTPLYKDGIIYLMNSSMPGKHAMAVRPGGSGDVTKTHVIWKNSKVGASHTSALLIGDRFVFFSGAGMGLSLAKGEVVQQERLDGLKNPYSSPIMAGGKIILFTRDSGGYVLDAKTLAVVSHNDLGDTSSINASPALSGGQIFIRSNQFLYCLGE